MYVQTAPFRLNISLQLESWNCFLPVWNTNFGPGASTPSCGANAVSWNPVTSYLFPHSPSFSTASCITRWGCQCWPNPALYHWPGGRHCLHYLNFTARDHEDKSIGEYSGDIPLLFCYDLSTLFLETLEMSHTGVISSTWNKCNGRLSRLGNLDWWNERKSIC